jgi:zinc protease
MRKQLLTAVVIVAALFLRVPMAGAIAVERYEGPGGLTVLLSERHDLPFVVASLMVRTGQRQEPVEKAGLAALAASLLTEGTRSRTSSEISNTVEFLGASLGAGAGRDVTTVTLSVLTKDLDTGFELFADVVLSPSFPEREIARQRDLTLGALRASEESPAYLAGRAFDLAVFGDHPYGRDTRGAPGSLAAITRADLISFHETWYRPGNAILAVAGDIDRPTLDALLKRFMGKWEARPVPGAAVPRAPEPRPNTIAIEKDLTQATVMLGHIGVARADPDYYALSVMNFILGGGGFSSRLMDRVRDQMGLTYGIYSTFDPAWDPGAFYVRVETKNDNAGTVVAETLAQIRRIRGERVGDDELSDAKSYLTGSFPRRLDTLGKIVGFLTQVEYYGLGLDYIERYSEYIDAVTDEDVLRVARAYLDPDRATLVVVGRLPEAGIAPSP